MLAGVLSLKVYRGVNTRLHAIAAAVTTFRIYHRHHKRKLWWDDFGAVVSLFSVLLVAVTPWMRSEEYNQDGAQEQLIIAYWRTAIFFPLATCRLFYFKGCTNQYWLVHCSALSVKHTNAIAFICYEWNFWPGLFGPFVTEGLYLRAAHVMAVQCYLGNSLAIVSLCTELSADVCLITTPLRMLWRVKLPRKQRHLILSIFASSVLCSFAGIIYATLIFIFHAQPDPLRWGYPAGLLAHIKAAISLLVCDLLVVVTYLYCLFWRGGDDVDISEPTETRSNRKNPVQLTSILILTEISTMDVSTHLQDRRHPDM